MGRYCLSLCLLVLVMTQDCLGDSGKLKSDKLCSQCSKCDSSKCPASEAFPHMTTLDNNLIAGALQSDSVDANDRGVYSVPNVKGGESSEYNAYFGWKSTSGSVSGYHRFSNYMDKCSGGKSYLTVHKHGKVSLRSLTAMESLAEADWKSVNTPPKLNDSQYKRGLKNYKAWSQKPVFPGI